MSELSALREELRLVKAEFAARVAAIEARVAGTKRRALFFVVPSF